MVTLRPHQVEASSQIDKSWIQHRNVLSILPTGAGKTILKAQKAMEEVNRGGTVIIFAHRDVLLEQISAALCLFGLPHTFITSKPVRTSITDMHVREYGQSFWVEGSKIIVASVDKYGLSDTTYIDGLITLWMLDEAHHYLGGGKWDKCIDPLVNARGLGVTATPLRADKKGLGAWSSGVFDDMVVGATMGQLIERGMLAPYRIYVPPCQIDMTGMRATASGDYNQKELAKRSDKASITGDAVQHYQRLAPGKQAIAFTVNIEHGEHVANAFKNAGISAVNLSSKTPPAERAKRIMEFKQGKIKILVNCDLFGEGFDVPAVECVIMLRKTESYSLFKQQFGRALRVLAGKEYGILIDHVGNVDYMMHTYGLTSPHDDPVWTLDDARKMQKGAGEPIPSRRCYECNAKYVPKTASDKECPYCEHEETEAESLDTLKKLQAKEGNLVEMSIDFIDGIMTKKREVDMSEEEFKNRPAIQNLPQVAKNSVIANHRKRGNAQIVLRDLIKRWLEHEWMYGEHDIESAQRQFEIVFKVNYLKAQVLSEREALELTTKIQRYKP